MDAVKVDPVDFPVEVEDRRDGEVDRKVCRRLLCVDVVFGAAFNFAVIFPAKVSDDARGVAFACPGLRYAHVARRLHLLVPTVDHICVADRADNGIF